MSDGVHDLRDMTFDEEPIQAKIDTALQRTSIDKVEREILRDYYLRMHDWRDIVFRNLDTCEMRLSLNKNYLCTIKCGKTHASNSDDVDTEYEALVTWPRDGRQERWKLIARRKYNQSEKFIYSFVYESLASPAVAADQNPSANRVTPADDRHILAKYFPKMEASKEILSTNFRDENFHIDCRWEGRRLCTLHCRKEDISFPRAEAAMRGATVADDRYILGTHENLTVYNLVVKWGRQQPDESWTLKVVQTGYKPKMVIEFKYNGPSSPVTDVQHDRERLNDQGCRIAGLLQRLGEMTTI